MRTYRQCLVSLGASFAGKRLSAISAFDIERYKQARLKGGVRAMVNREREVLRAVYNRCREWGKYEGDNPAVRVKGVREDERRLRFLDADEEARLLAAATAPGLRAIILVGIHAGLRIESEVLTLTPGDLDFRTGLLTVHSAFAKNGKTRRMPLNALLRATLRPLVGQGLTLFLRREGTPYRSIRTAFETACRSPRRDTAHPAAYLREPARHGRRRPAHRAGARRVVIPRPRAALRAPEPRP